MSGTTIRTLETAPASYPATPDDFLSDAAASLDPAMLWQRIEGYTAWRSTERAVTWIAEGSGEWVPTLRPAAITTTEVWIGDAWEATTLGTSPMGGYMLPGCGPYRFTGTAGDNEADIPAALWEAFRRLAEYAAARAGAPGARVEERKIGEALEFRVERSASWMAQALQNSGAADLLRSYRRA